MSFPIHMRLNGGEFEIEFVPNAQNLVTTIWIRNTVPGSVFVYLSHPTSGYVLEDPTNPGQPREFVLGAPISINIPPPRRFPDDQTIDGYAIGHG